MTLVFGGGTLGELIQSQFGVNEISSMITIGKAIGSVVTRPTESSIFDPLALQYGIRVTRIPPWLRNVDLARSGAILGQNQRKVDVQNTMEKLDIDSLAGVATLFVLILRFVQPGTDIVDDIEQLLKGHYGIVDGGSLSDSGRSASDNSQQKHHLPFSFRRHLRTFVNSVVDADAQSSQRRSCMKHMAHEAYGASGDYQWQLKPVPTKPDVRQV